MTEVVLEPFCERTKNQSKTFKCFDYFIRILSVFFLSLFCICCNRQNKSTLTDFICALGRESYPCTTQASLHPTKCCNLLLAPSPKCSAVKMIYSRMHWGTISSNQNCCGFQHHIHLRMSVMYFSICTICSVVYLFDQSQSHKISLHFVHLE